MLAMAQNSTSDVSPTSIRWPADLKAELDELARLDGRKFSNLVIETMRRALPDLRKRVGAKPQKS